MLLLEEHQLHPKPCWWSLWVSLPSFLSQCSVLLFHARMLAVMKARVGDTGAVPSHGAQCSSCMCTRVIGLCQGCLSEKGLIVFLLIGCRGIILN